MTRQGPPPVEPLSDIAWARVEKSVMNALDEQAVQPAPVASITGRPRWRKGAIVCGIALSAAIALLALWPRAGRHHRQDLPSRVTTASAPTTVSFGDAEITVAPASALVLGGNQADGVEIVLERGGATFAVAPRRGRPPFVVHAGAADVKVVGTRFTVTRSGDAARVDVAHGEVEVVAHGRRELLLAGDSWDSSREREAATRSSATVANPGDVAAARLSSSEPTAAVADDAAAAVGVPLPAAVAPAGIKHATPPPAPPAPAVDPRVAFEEASSLEASDPAAALEAYREIARGSGPWAANALYAAARLALDRGDASLATTLARSYLGRFPRGANAADATALIERAAATAPATPTP